MGAGRTCLQGGEHGGYIWIARWILSVVRISCGQTKVSKVSDHPYISSSLASAAFIS